MLHRWATTLLLVLTTSTTAAADPTIEAIREKVRVAVGYDAFQKLEHGVRIVVKDKSDPKVTSVCFLHRDGRFAIHDARFGMAKGFDGRSAWQRGFNNPPLPEDLRVGEAIRLLGGLLTHQWLSPASGYVVDTDPVESRSYRLCVRVHSSGGNSGFGRVYLDPATWLPTQFTVQQDQNATVAEVSAYRDISGTKVFSRFEVNRYISESEMVPESVAVNLPGSNPFSPPTPANDTQFDPSVPKAVEARAAGGFLLVRPSINGKPGPWLLVNTGMCATVLTRPAADRLGLARVAMTAQGHGYSRPIDRFTLGPATIRGLTTAEFANEIPTLCAALTGVEVGGYLGADVLARCVMEGNWSTGTVTLHEPAGYFPPPAAVWEPAWFDAGVPHIFARVERRHAGLFRVLTGINYPLHLHPAVVRDRGLLDGRKTEPYELLTGSGPTFCRVGMVAELRMFGQRLPQVATRFDADVSQSERQYPRLLGELNPCIFPNGVIVFDYPGRRIGLRRQP
ncbi:MAG TPA: hypothetical protein VD866_26330 [Urbifossiella sp.]|nr:hypothetical protein [Urbifossiella sp.]